MGGGEEVALHPSTVSVSHKQAHNTTFKASRPEEIRTFTSAGGRVRPWGGGIVWTLVVLGGRGVGRGREGV